MYAFLGIATAFLIGHTISVAREKLTGVPRFSNYNGDYYARLHNPVPADENDHLAYGDIRAVHDGVQPREGENPRGTLTNYPYSPLGYQSGEVEVDMTGLPLDTMNGDSSTIPDGFLGNRGRRVLPSNVRNLTISGRQLKPEARVHAGFDEIFERQMKPTVRGNPKQTFSAMNQRILRQHVGEDEFFNKTQDREVRALEPYSQPWKYNLGIDQINQLKTEIDLAEAQQAGFFKNKRLEIPSRKDVVRARGYWQKGPANLDEYGLPAREPERTLDEMRFGEGKSYGHLGRAPTMDGGPVLIDPAPGYNTNQERVKRVVLDRRSPDGTKGAPRRKVEGFISNGGALDAPDGSKAFGVPQLNSHYNIPAGSSAWSGNARPDVQVIGGHILDVDREAPFWDVPSRDKVYVPGRIEEEHPNVSDNNNIYLEQGQILRPRHKKKIAHIAEEMGINRRWENNVVSFVPGRLQEHMDDFEVRENNRMHNEDKGNRLANPHMHGEEADQGQHTRDSGTQVHSGTQRPEIPFQESADARAHAMQSERRTKHKDNKRREDVIRTETPMVDRVGYQGDSRKSEMIGKLRKAKFNRGRIEITGDNPRQAPIAIDGHRVNTKLEQSVIGHSRRPQHSFEPEMPNDKLATERVLTKKNKGVHNRRLEGAKLRGNVLMEPEMDAPQRENGRRETNYVPNRF